MRVGFGLNVNAKLSALRVMSLALLPGSLLTRGHSVFSLYQDVSMGGVGRVAVMTNQGQGVCKLQKARM